MKNRIDEILTSATSAADNLKDCIDKTDDNDLKKAISQLYTELDTVKSEVIAIISENELQKSEIRWLRTKIEGAGEFKQKGEIYYTQSGDGPFCPFCFEKRGKKYG